MLGRFPGLLHSSQWTISDSALENFFGIRLYFPFMIFISSVPPGSWLRRGASASRSRKGCSPKTRCLICDREACLRRLPARGNKASLLYLSNSSPFGFATVATPRSPILTELSIVKKMFNVFKSLCRMFLECSAYKPRQI